QLIQPLAEHPLGVLAVPCVEKLLHLSGIGRVGKRHEDPPALHLHTFVARLARHHLEAVLPAEVAVCLTADVLAGWQMRQIAREFSLLAQDPGGALVDFLLHARQVAALRRDDRHPQVGVDVDSQRLPVAVDECVLDGGVAVPDAVHRHSLRPSRFLATSTSSLMMLSTVSPSSGVLSLTARYR